jgi:diguanylate cyclase (GGDEF)-like protein
MSESQDPQRNPTSAPAGGRRATRAAVAVLCVAAGGIGSLLGAHAVAHSDGRKAQKTFHEASSAIATTLKLAIQRQEELAVSASTYFAQNPTASRAEFDAWAKWARTTRRYPELASLALLKVVRAPELAAFAAQATGHALKPQGSTPPPAASPVFSISPASDHRYFCLATAELARGAGTAAPTGFDYCAQSSALLLSRNSGVSIDAPLSAGGSKALGVLTPVYRGNVTPRSTAGRMAASVGWVRQVLVPGVVLAQVLQGHPSYAVGLRYRTSSGTITFADGVAPRGAQSSTVDLHDGWTVTSFGAAAGSGVPSDGHALAVLIAGLLLSLLLGVLILRLRSGRPSTPALATGETGELPADPLYDVLTGLPSRALILDRAECMVARAGRQSELLVGALFIDIDWFKDINERLGRTAGDQLLKVVADRLQSVVRAGDSVGRFQGDQFVVLVESAARSARLDSLARRAIEALHRPFALDDFGPSFLLTASIGVAFGRYATAEDLLHDAQLALHSAKAAGKDRSTLFNANMRSVIEDRGVLEGELNTALVEKQFFLLYQPIYDLRTRRVVGLEAFVRWAHPKRGIMAPADFIPLAEETGLIVPIGRWVLEEACGRAAAWNVAGHELTISVKVSANQLNRDVFATDVRRALQQSGIEPSLLTLEIDETTVMADVTAAAARLEEIKQLGAQIAIDDFGGSGYAYHSDLRRLPLDYLKVDRSSLAAADEEDYRNWLLEAILIVGRDLSVPVIAKEIETHEQMTALQAMGCMLAQGFFMGKPTPADAVESVLQAGLPSSSPISGSAEADGALGI